MISIQLRRKRQLNRQKDTLRKNIGRVLVLKQQKFVFKLQNTVQHLYIRIYKAGDNTALLTVSTIKYSKAEGNQGQRIVQIIPQMISELINLIKKHPLLSDISEDQIIWYLGGGKFQGRIKVAIQNFLHNLKNMKDNAQTSFTDQQEQAIKN